MNMKRRLFAFAFILLAAAPNGGNSQQRVSGRVKINGKVNPGTGGGGTLSLATLTDGQLATLSDAQLLSLTN
jgi:hypothetical protein